MQGSTSKLKEKGAELLPSTSGALRFNFQYKKKGKPWGMWSTHYFSVVLARLSRSTADLKRAWQFLIPPTSLVIGSVVTLFQPPSEEERAIALVSGLASLEEAFGGIGFPSSRGGEKSPSPTSAESAADFPAVCFSSLKQTCQVRSFQAGEGLNKTRQFFRFQINASCCRQYKPSICEGWQPKGTRESWKCFLRQRQIRLRSDMEGQS